MVKLYFCGSTSLADSALLWSVGVMGGSLLDLPLARHALERDGHLRVGIEDTGSSSVTNVETVPAAVALCADVGRPVARDREARDVLGGGFSRA